ncbi:MAG: ATP synthase F1 subunit delta [Patescibacteria group bacterium]
MKTTCNVADIARALISVAMDAKAVPKAVTDVMTVADAVASRPDLLIDLEERAVPIGRRQDALRAALGNTVEPCVLNALLVLQAATALRALPTFVAEVRAAAEKLADHRVADVSTAEGLTADERKRLETALSKRFGGTIDLRERTDSSLIGGAVVQVGAWCADSSLRGTLERLNQHLYV